MTFQEFLATKRALAIVEHMETLSEADALELFESLDDATVELIEQLLDEAFGQRKAGVEMANIQKQMDDAVNTPSGDSPDQTVIDRLQIRYDDIASRLQATGRSVRGAKRVARTIRAKGARAPQNRTTFNFQKTPILKGADLQAHVDAKHKANQRK